MGTVYLAEHTFMGWRAAVKVLRRSLADDKVLVTRFINEARAAKAVGHANIIEILDVGILPDGLPYLLMEMLEGETLGARCKRLGRLPVDQALALTRQAAAGLGAAHDAGIVHRDLKPDNLFIVPDADAPGGDKVKVLDFGIAKLSDGKLDDGNQGEARTLSGVLLGTPAYMSPEQCRGVPVDHRSDIYALSVILYEMLAGKPPFTSAGAGELLLLHASAPVPSVRLENPAVPQFVETALLRGLAKAREQRFQSMRELAAALLGVRQQTRLLEPARRPRPLRPTVEVAAAVTPMSWPTAGTWSSRSLRGQVRAIVIGAAIAIPLILLIDSDVVRTPPPPPVEPVAAQGSGRGGLTPADPPPPTPAAATSPPLLQRLQVQRRRGPRRWPARKSRRPSLRWGASGPPARRR